MASRSTSLGAKSSASSDLCRSTRCGGWSFSHLDISEAARHRLAPGVTWWGWRLPSFVEVGFVLVLGLALLSIAIFRFTRTE